MSSPLFRPRSTSPSSFSFFFPRRPVSFSPLPPAQSSHSAHFPFHRPTPASPLSRSPTGGTHLLGASPTSYQPPSAMDALATASPRCPSRSRASSPPLWVRMNAPARTLATALPLLSRTGAPPSIHDRPLELTSPTTLAAPPLPSRPYKSAPSPASPHTSSPVLPARTQRFSRWSLERCRPREVRPRRYPTPPLLPPLQAPRWVPFLLRFIFVLVLLSLEPRRLNSSHVSAAPRAVVRRRPSAYRRHQPSNQEQTTQINPIRGSIDPIPFNTRTCCGRFAKSPLKFLISHVGPPTYKDLHT
jgi:hypothetical protein